MPAGKDRKVAGAGQENKMDRARAISEVKTALLIAVPIIMVFLVFFLIILPSPLFSVPFSTFRSNFDSAKRIALLVTYHNDTQYVYESQCFSALVQTIAFTRNASTIDFYILNQTNCTFSPGGLGHTLNVTTKPVGYCLSLVSSEPSIFLNYSSTNKTIVRAYQLYVLGNREYMTKCPIAVSMS